MIRAATPAERTDVEAFFDGLDRGLADEVIAGQEIAVVEREGVVAVVLVSPGVLDLPDTLIDGGDHGGLRIGTLDDGFRLDLQGAILAARHTRRQVVRVSEKATRLFLYHRDVLGDSVLEADPALAFGDACIVVNPRREAIGIGRVVGTFKGQSSAVRSVHDLGTYLRDQG